MEIFKTAVILAGGKSSRMGFDKQFLKLDEKFLMDIVIGELQKEFSEIIVVTNKVEIYKDTPYKVICDKIKNKGPLSGIHVGLKASSSKYVYFIACDMPNVNIEYIRYMKEKIRNIDVGACITKEGDKIEPLNGFYSKSIIKDIEYLFLKDKRAIISLIERVNTYYIEEKAARIYSSNWDMFLNLNTKEDLKNYMQARNLT
ncbi:molybdenum cofactor guanylyltransferase [Clostridium sp. DJ247]|uniref:molybdenum cofactor guanylyltransferase n=1 Tax=Clostridium sp. DJ247 TaxID=2726188 RepID=UPI0016252A07|nr:molybdenum cofactor guanylyltransferase [Clostridium sp. DJ247]MBC2582350.1 molybdenum cofactor guanylyltransferase [Clostridium sp. DJ247]